MSRDHERTKQPLPAAGPRTEERKPLRWLDFLRGGEGRKGPAGEEQERLRSHVVHASKILPPKGPIHGFVAQNPLQGLEDLPFDQAVREARRLLGGQGYLSNDAFRRIAAGGRITPDDLMRALTIRVPHLLNHRPIAVRGRSVEAGEVCLAHLQHGIEPLPHANLHWQISQGKATRRFRQDVPAETRASLLKRAAEELQGGLERLGTKWTLAEWFHACTNLDPAQGIRKRIGNDVHLYASARAPSQRAKHDVARPFWGWWRSTRATITMRIGRTPEAHIDRCLEDLGIPLPRRAGYVSVIDRHHGVWEGSGQGSAITPQEFAAMWLHYERQFLSKLAPRHLGTGGTLPAIQHHFQRELEAYALSSLWAAVLAKLGLEDLAALEDQERRAEEVLRHRVLAVARDGMAQDAQRIDFVQHVREALERDIGRIGPEYTLGGFCERLTGASVTGPINDQMMKWCGAFLDEGLAGWPMPNREGGFYDAWRKLAERDLTCWFLGIKDFRKKVRRLPPHPEDALIQSLRIMGVPERRWTEYLTLHLAALPGWAGMVRWRETHPLYEMQQHHPIDLTQYLAVRLFYEVELVFALCRTEWETAGTVSALLSYFRAHPGEYLARSRIAAGDLPGILAGGVVRTGQGTIRLNWDPFSHPGYGDMQRSKGLSRRDQWARFGEMLYASREGEGEGHHPLERVCHDAWRLFHLAQLLGLSAGEIRELPEDGAQALLALLDDLPATAHGPIWLEAYESQYRDQFLTLLNRKRGIHERNGPPGAQLIFCLDMREEGIRRHVEAQSETVETFGTAGFFHMPLIFRSLATGIARPSCPIPIDPRHTVVETVRPGQDKLAARYHSRKKWKEAVHGIYHRLETNFVTAYSLIDFLGVSFGITVTGRTLLPRRWREMAATLRDKLIPPVQTSVHVERPGESEIRELLAARDRDRILETVPRWARRKDLRDRLSAEAVEELRQVALAGDGHDGQTQVARLLNLSRAEERALVDELRRKGVDPHHRLAQLAEFDAMGFSLEEQVDLVEALLRMIGLTHNFARLVVFCGHGSTTENNPYAAAYHCGACGGAPGGANARAVTAMGNDRRVRALLVKRGIDIPEETYFLGAEHDTAADRLTFFDTEDLPPTHREEFRRLAHDLEQACGRHALERCRHLPGAPENPTLEEALHHVRTRSVDWAQVYPEWGHARCAAMVIGRRELTRGLSLDRRAYLQSYDPDQDPDGSILAEIMAAFIPVVRGINLDYYFSTVDSGINGVFGAGTKAIHNVVGLVGVMQGAGSDLKHGLPAQGVVPLHEPMRALLVIEATTARIGSIIERYKVLKDLFENQWAHLVAWVPGTGEFMWYRQDGRWKTLSPGEGIPAMREQQDRAE